MGKLTFVPPPATRPGHLAGEGAVDAATAELEVQLHRIVLKHDLSGPEAGVVLGTVLTRFMGACVGALQAAGR